MGVSRLPQAQAELNENQRLQMTCHSVAARLQAAEAEGSCACQEARSKAGASPTWPLYSRRLLVLFIFTSSHVPVTMLHAQPVSPSQCTSCSGSCVAVRRLLPHPDVEPSEQDVLHVAVLEGGVRLRQRPGAGLAAQPCLGSRARLTSQPCLDSCLDACRHPSGRSGSCAAFPREQVQRSTDRDPGPPEA